MAQRFLNVRVRPARITILIDRNAKDLDILLAFQFLSKLWGGRFGQILVVDPEFCDELTRFRLGVSRPDFIYGISLNDAHWTSAVQQACQPRGYGRLRPEFVEDIRNAYPEDYFLIDHALIHLFRTRDKTKTYKQMLRLVTTETSSSMAAFCAATFGVHHQNLREDLFDLNTSFTELTPSAFVELATEFVRERQQSWLDVTGHELIPLNKDWGLLVPTVVLVRNCVSDLSLFWNLRTASNTSNPAWIIPIPVESVSEPSVVGKLKDWLLSFLAYGHRPNFCQVTSQTVSEEECLNFACELQSQLVGSPIEAADYEAPPNRLPIVLPYEYEVVWPVDVTGRKVTIHPPRPRAFEDLITKQAWLVDLIKDVKTGRAILDMHLPPGHVVQELLNGPCPPSFGQSSPLRIGDGVDSVNIRCSGHKEIINFHLPRGDEVLEEILREHGVEPLIDEKRSGYLPVIRRFGGIRLAANAFVGKTGQILMTLKDEPKTLREIKGSCQLGDGTIPGESYLDRVESLHQYASERIKRIARRRFAQYARDQSPESPRLASFLEFWSDKSVLTREWKIGPCSRCNQISFVPRLDIQRRIICPVCGNRIGLPEFVPLGYALHRTVRRSVNEGIIPVVLTGRFLHRMSNNGFFWLPGVKYKIGDKAGDIDLIACCDGHLVFCECKELKDTPPGANVWDNVIDQFLETAIVAKKCEASLVVLAANVSEYPTDVRARIESEIGNNIPHLLLERLDLQSGFRQIQDSTPTRTLGFSDILPIPFLHQSRKPKGKPRIINMSWGITYSS